MTALSVVIAALTSCSGETQQTTTPTIDSPPIVVTPIPVFSNSVVNSNLAAIPAEIATKLREIGKGSSKHITERDVFLLRHGSHGQEEAEMEGSHGLMTSSGEG